MDSQPLDKLIPCLIPLIHQVAHRYLNDHSDIEDLTQEVLVKLVTAAKRQALRTSSVPSWVFATTKNASIDVLRHLRRRRLHEDFRATAQLNSWSDPDQPRLDIAVKQENALNSDLQECLPEILSTLPDNQRMALLMRVAGYSYYQIADRQGVTLGTVRSRIHYAKEKARPLLEAYR